METNANGAIKLEYGPSSSHGVSLRNNVLPTQSHLVSPHKGTIHNHVVLPLNNAIKSHSNVTLSLNNIAASNTHTVTPNTNAVTPNTNAVTPHTNVVIPHTNVVIPPTNVVIPHTNVDIPHSNVSIHNNTVSPPNNYISPHISLASPHKTLATSIPHSPQRNKAPTVYSTLSASPASTYSSSSQTSGSKDIPVESANKISNQNGNRYGIGAGSNGNTMFSNYVDISSVVTSNGLNPSDPSRGLMPPPPLYSSVSGIKQEPGTQTCTAALNRTGEIGKVPTSYQ